MDNYKIKQLLSRPYTGTADSNLRAILTELVARTENGGGGGASIRVTNMPSQTTNYGGSYNAMASALGITPDECLSLLHGEYDKIIIGNNNSTIEVPITTKYHSIDNKGYHSYYVSFLRGGSLYTIRNSDSSFTTTTTITVKDWYEP